ncbi:MAG TPA: DUF58 domain-containing protein [Anaerolineales bacterium]|jgi:uncharacterized protein (DUF58 family)
MVRFLPVLFLLIIIGAAMRDDFAITLVYLFLAAILAGSWWSKRSLAQVTQERRMNSHAFLDEKVPVRLKFQNQGWLPVLWLNIQDELPVALSTNPNFSRVTSLAPHAAIQFDYTLEARTRGYYPIGPLVTSTGDILGLHNQQQKKAAAHYLTVYPRIVPLTFVHIPSHSPQGTLRHHQPVYEDPTRIFSKREYTPGDSLRRVDWKASAASGRLQVKLFEPSISLETFIFLDLNAENYAQRGRFDATELAVVVAASLAAWVSSKSQSVGLNVNGKDPLAGVPRMLPPNRGQAHLVRLLEVLARVEMNVGKSLTALIHRQRYSLAWGSTLIVITGRAEDLLLEELYQARRAGQEAMLILVGQGGYSQELARRAALLGILLVCIASLRDLDIWRR